MFLASALYLALEIIFSISLVQNVRKESGFLELSIKGASLGEWIRGSVSPLASRLMRSARGWEAVLHDKTQTENRL